MFHCSGWTFTWAVTATGGTHVCLRKVEPKRIFDAIVRASRHPHVRRADRAQHAGACAGRGQAAAAAAHQGGDRRRRASGHRHRAHGGAWASRCCTSTAPPRATVPPPTARRCRSGRRCPTSERYTRMARQGIPNPLIEHLMVADPRTLEPVPRDGATIGEIMLSGNTLMKGYLKNEAATEEAFAGGIYHSGDLAAWHGDGSVEVKDRSKDIIISGGENISSLEVEEVLYRHPQVMEAAVVARARREMGRAPLRLRHAEAGQRARDGGGHHRLLPRQHGPLQGAADGGFRAAAEDVDRQDPEVRPARQDARNPVTARVSATVGCATWTHGRAVARCGSRDITAEPLQGTLCAVNHCLPGLSRRGGMPGKHRTGLRG